MKNIPKIRFPEFSGEWMEKKLGEVCEFKQGVQVDISLHENTKNKKNVRFLRIENYTQNSKNFRYIPKKFAKNNFICKKDIVIVRYGATAGFVGRGLRGVLANNLFRVIPNQNILTNQFLFYILKHPKIFNYFQSEMAGAAMPAISFNIAKSLKIHLPPTIEEQQKIASFLSSIDEKIEITTKKIEKLKKYKKGLLQKLLNVKNKEPELRFPEFSREWVEKRLGEVCEFFKGKGISKSDVISEKLRIENGKLRKCIHYGELFTIYKERINFIVSYTEKKDGFIGKKGDLLFPSSDVTPDGLAKVSSLNVDNVLIGNDVIIARCEENINSNFLSYQINQKKKEILKLVTGSTIKHIYPKDLKSLKIYIPPTLIEQQKIASFLSSIDEKIELNEQKLTKLKEYKKGLLQKMFV